MKIVKLMILLFALVVAGRADAGVRSVKGLWVSTSDDRLYWLRLQVPAGPSTGLVEELSGTMTTGSVGGSAQTTSATEVTGQYLIRTGIVVLNFGKPGSNRMYAVGDTHGEGRHMNLRLFRVRAGQDLDFECDLFFDPKSEAQKP